MVEQLVKAPKIKAFVIGWPISHSLSPHLHKFWLSQYGIDGSYEKIAVAPQKLEKFLNEFKQQGFVGGNVTIPHKENTYSLLETNDEIAKKLQAANTLYIKDDQIHTTNTDGFGFTANLDQFSNNWRGAKTATILGAGGAAKAIALALINVGIAEIRIVNRTRERAVELANLMGKSCKAYGFDDSAGLMPSTHLLVNTTALGMKGQPPLQIDISNLPDSAIVTDIVYNPLETELLKTAKSQGLKTVDGIGMLLHQAVPGFEKWFGIRPKVTPQLRAHMLKILKEPIP